MNRPEPIEERLGSAFDIWSNWSYKYHLSAVAVLATWTVLRWWTLVFSTEPMVDEAVYLKAFRATGNGDSPFSVEGFFYPASFAVAGAWLLELLSERGMLAVMRSLLVLGVASIVWTSLAWFEATWIQRVVVGVGFLGIAPAVLLGMASGNASLIVIGLMLPALTLWRGWPIFWGVILGLTVAIKQLAGAAIPGLLFHRPAEGGRRHWISGGTAVLIAGLLLVPSLRTFGEMSSQPIASIHLTRSISLLRLLDLFGMSVPPLLNFAVVSAVTVAVVRRQVLDRPHLLALLCTASILALPIIWSHTLLLVLPLQVMSIQVALWRRGSGERSRPLERFELPLVILGTAAIQLSDGAGAVNNQAAWVQLLPILVVYLAPIGLCWYLLRRLPQLLSIGSEDQRRNRIAG